MPRPRRRLATRSFIQPSGWVWIETLTIKTERIGDTFHPAFGLGVD